MKPLLLGLLAASALLCAEHRYCPKCPRDPRGHIVRSSKAKRDFQGMHPCPATGKTTGPCRGYVIDHIKPLACGGADKPSNLQWQTIAEAKKKDRIELIGCK